MGEHADSATKHIVDVVTTILTEKNIMVPMRDGVQLATDIYRPADGAPTPVLMARTPALSSVAVSLSVMVWPSAGYSSAGATETVVGIVIEPLFSFGIAMGAVSRKAGRRHANRICIVTHTSANPIIRNGGNISVSLCICNDFTESREYNIVTYQS